MNPEISRNLKMQVLLFRKWQHMNIWVKSWIQRQKRSALFHQETRKNRWDINMWKKNNIEHMKKKYSCSIVPFSFRCWIF